MSDNAILFHFSCRLAVGRRVWVTSQIVSDMRRGGQLFKSSPGPCVQDMGILADGMHLCAAISSLGLHALFAISAIESPSGSR